MTEQGASHIEGPIIIEGSSLRLPATFPYASWVEAKTVRLFLNRLESEFSSQARLF